MIDTSPQQSSEEDDEDENDEAVKLSWGRKRKERVVFSDKDLDDVRSHFKSLVQATPSKKVRKSLFEKLYNENSLKSLRKRFGKQAILSKVRTERKRFLES